MFGVPTHNIISPSDEKGTPKLRTLLHGICAAVKFATQVCKIVKNENEPHKYQNLAGVAQKHKVEHPGSMSFIYTAYHQVFSFIET